MSQHVLKPFIAITLLLLGIAACRGRVPAPNAACPSIYQPVCGADDHKTYSNSCEAAKAGQTRTTDGECKDISIQPLPSP